jgi:hypothetical protein
MSGQAERDSGHGLDAGVNATKRPVRPNGRSAIRLPVPVPVPVPVPARPARM